MKKLILMMSLAVATVGLLNGCKSKDDNSKPSDESIVRETVEEYLLKKMKNPESLKIISCEVRLDSVPFYLRENLLDLADKFGEAFEEYELYKDRSSYIWAEEQFESLINLADAKESLETAYKEAQEDFVDIEYIAYVKSSGTNSLGGTVSNSTIVILDKDDPKRILGSFEVDRDFIKQFVVLKMAGSDFEYEFKTNKFGKYITDGLPYFEQFVMNDAE